MSKVTNSYANFWSNCVQTLPHFPIKRWNGNLEAIIISIIMPTTTEPKGEMLDLAGVQKFVEGFIKYSSDRPGQIFSYVTKKEFPGVTRKLYYDFYAGATGRRYEAGDLQKLATEEGRNLLRRLVAMFGALTRNHMQLACEENGIHGAVRSEYMSIDFDMDAADRIHSGRRLYLAHVNRQPSQTKPADQEHFNRCNGAGLDKGPVTVFDVENSALQSTPKPVRPTVRRSPQVPTNPKFHLFGKRGMTHHRDADAAAEAERVKLGDCI